MHKAITSLLKPAGSHRAKAKSRAGHSPYATSDEHEARAAMPCRLLFAQS